MPFVLDNLNSGMQFGSSEYRWWRYEHASENLTAMTTAGYFNNARDLLKRGDIITLVPLSAGVPTAPQNVIVTASPPTGDVTVLAFLDDDGS